MTKKRRTGPTALDVAKVAGVAPATAARALGNYSSVSPEVCERVINAAESLGYRPNRLARSMVTGWTQTLGVVIANIEDQFFSRIVRGVADEARAAGFDVVLANSDEHLEEERRAIRVLTEKQVDGLIIAAADLDDHAHLVEVRDYGLPLVLLDRNIGELEVDAVVIDGLDAAEEATTYLVELGHSEIAIVTDVPAGMALPADFAAPDHVSTKGARLAGYIKALEQAGLPVNERLIRHAPPTVEGAREQTLALLESGQPASAIFATDNTMTIGVLEGLQQRNVAIPKQVSLFGFDDLEWTKVTRPPLSVVSQPIYDLGATAARTLLARIDGWDAPPQVHALPTELVHRASATRA